MKLCFLLLFFSLMLSTSIAQSSGGLIETIVIDPGHGGKDPGAVGAHCREKDIVLSVAKTFGALIKEKYPKVKIIYTRNTDEFITLQRRADIANKNGADLFVSLHCNAIGRNSVQGVETFVMGLHKSDENLEVAKKENASIFLETNYEDTYEGFDPNSVEDYITLSLFQGGSIDQSLILANSIQTKLIEVENRKDRGVKPAGFWVLYKTTAPGVLVELGFISNPEEEKFLISKSGQQKIATALLTAFDEYKQTVELKNTQQTPISSLSSEANEVVEKNTIPPMPTSNEKLFYTQLLTSEKLLSHEDFDLSLKVVYIKHNGTYKYFSGASKTLKEASKTKKLVRKIGYKDAFLVAYKNAKKVGLKE